MPTDLKARRLDLPCSFSIAMRSTVKLLLVALVPLMACGDDGEGEIDPAECETQVYRITSVDVPVDARAASRAAVDIDFDGLSDNAAGGLIGALIVTMNIEGMSERVNRGIAGDGAPWFLRLSLCKRDRVLLKMLRGQDYDQDGVYETEDRGAVSARGTIDSGLITAFDGSGEIPAGLFVDPLERTEQPWARWLGSTVQLRMEQDELSGKIGVGLSPGYFEVVGPPLAAYFTYRIERGDSDYAANADANGDGTVTMAELRTFFFFLLPDIDVLDPIEDFNDSLSFSLELRAERVNQL